MACAVMLMCTVDLEFRPFSIFAGSEAVGETRMHTFKPTVSGWHDMHAVFSVTLYIYCIYTDGSTGVLVT